MQEFQGFWRGEGISFELFSCPQVLAVGRETSENLCLSDEHPVKESSLRLSSGRIELGLVVARRTKTSSVSSPRVSGMRLNFMFWRLEYALRYRSLVVSYSNFFWISCSFCLTPQADL